MTGKSNSQELLSTVTYRPRNWSARQAYAPRKPKRLMYLSARYMPQATSERQYAYVDIANAIRMHSRQTAKVLQELRCRMASGSWRLRFKLDARKIQRACAGNQAPAHG